MNQKIIAIALIALGTLFTSIAATLYKLGADSWNFITIFIGFCLYFTAGILLILALKRAEVTLVYPVFATSYIWVLIIAFFLFKEKFNFIKIFSIFLIILGITALSFGSHQQTNQKIKAELK